MTNRRKAILTVLAIALIAWGILTLNYRLTEHGPESSVSANGTIEATEIDVSPRVAGRIARLMVDEGSSVKKGQVIAVLSAHELNARVESAKGGVESAKARLADLMKGTREEQIRAARAAYESALASAKGTKEIASTSAEAYSKSTELRANLAVAQANYASALQDYNTAQASYELVRKGPRAEDIAALKAAVDQSRARYTEAEKNFARSSILYQKSAISAQQLDTARANQDAQKANLDAAEARYNEALAGSRPEEIRQAKARMDQASVRLTGQKKVLATASEAYRDRLASLQQLQSARTSANTAADQVAAAKANLDLAVNGYTIDQIKTARGQLEQAKGSLAEAKSNLGQIVIRAPEDGVILTKFREIGEVVTPGTPLVRLANLNNVWVRVYAPLPTLGAIKVGQTASVTTDSYKGRVYTGRVASIKQESEFTPKNVQTSEERVKLVYAVRIDVPNANLELKPGMPADASIELGRGSRNR